MPDGGMPHNEPHCEHWWHVFDAYYSELRSAGFSPSGCTLAIATSSDLSLWTRATLIADPQSPPAPT